MTLVIAHRGASAYEVENSLAAFRRARELHADAVELDIHSTADGVPVVHHDPTVDGARIDGLPAVKLGRYTLANDEAIPTLADALAAMGTELEVFVEVKELAEIHDRRLLEVLDGGPAPDRYHVHAFDHRIVRRLRAARPSLPCAVLSASYPINPLTQLRDAGVTELWQVQSLVDQAMVDTLHAAGCKIFVWTVDDPAHMRTLASYGVDGICTNTPDVARTVLA